MHFVLTFTTLTLTQLVLGNKFWCGLQPAQPTYQIRPCVKIMEKARVPRLECKLYFPNKILHFIVAIEIKIVIFFAIFCNGRRSPGNIYMEGQLSLTPFKLTKIILGRTINDPFALELSREISAQLLKLNELITVNYPTSANSAKANMLQ